MLMLSEKAHNNQIKAKWCSMRRRPQDAIVAESHMLIPDLIESKPIYE